VAKASIKGTETHWAPSAGIWKKILTSSYNNGSIRDIYWKLIGTKADKSTEQSEARSFQVGIPQAVTINVPSSGTMLPSGTPPTFDFAANCNTKFRLEFSSLEDFSDSKMMKGFNYSTKDPNAETTLQKALSSSQWTSVKKLMGTGTGYFRIKAWDGLKRDSVSEVRAFTVR